MVTTLSLPTPGLSRRLAARVDGPALILGGVGLGSVLGLVSVAIDGFQHDSALGRVLLVMFSTGMSWAAAAFVTGRLSGRPATAALAGAATLLAATIAYYGGIALFGTRPSASSADLLSAATVWAVVGGPAGALLATLGWSIGSGDRTRRSLAWGTLGGLLASQGIASAMRFPEDLTGGGWPQTFVLLTVLVPTVIVMAATRRLRPVLALAVHVAVGAAAALGWIALLAVN